MVPLRAVKTPPHGTVKAKPEREEIRTRISTPLKKQTQYWIGLLEQDLNCNPYQSEIEKMIVSSRLTITEDLGEKQQVQ